MPKLRMIADLRPIEEVVNSKATNTAFCFVVPQNSNFFSHDASMGVDWSWYGNTGQGYHPLHCEQMIRTFTHFVPVSEIRFEEVE